MLAILSVFILLVFLIIVYEVYIIWNVNNGSCTIDDTISRILYLKSCSYPVIPLLIGLFVGFMAGHIYG
jgi:hypothetical protein